MGFKIKEIDLQKLPIQKIIIVALTIVSIIAMRTCNMKDIEVTSAGFKMEFYKAQSSLFEQKTNKLGERVATQVAMITERDKQVEEALLKNSKLAKLNTQIIVNSKTTATEILAPFINEVIESQEPDSQTVKLPCLPFGTQFQKTDKWFSLKGSVVREGVEIHHISFIDSTTINIGYKNAKGVFGFLKKKEPVVELINSSPYRETVSMQNITFKEKRPKWMKFGAGVLIGGLTSVYLLNK